MHTTERIGWFLIVTLCALGLLLALLGAARTAHCATPTLTDRLVVAQTSLATKVDPVDARTLADAIATTTKGNRQWSALLLTIAAHESALSQRIADGRCNLKIGECDGGRAWGLFQVHKNENNAAAWGSPDLAVQTTEAARMLRGAFYRCQGPYKELTPDWARRTLSAYAGRACDASWRGLDARAATFAKLSRAL